MPERVLRFSIEMARKDDVHATITFDIVQKTATVIGGLADEFHEERVRNKPISPVAKELWKKIQEYASVIEAEEKEAAVKTEAGAENVN